MTGRFVVLAFATAAASAMAVPPSRSTAAGESLPEIWSNRCASCHAVPDPEIRTDRAWLDQVHRTA